MKRLVRAAARLACVSFVCGWCVRAGAQSAPGAGTAELREIHSDGQKVLTEAQIAALTGLQTGTQVGRTDLQAGADKLVSSGLFATVKYDFKTKNDGVSLNFHVAESARVPVYYDNFPWFGDSEISDAIRAQLPFFDGTLPEDGYVLEVAAAAIHTLLASHKVDFPVQHQVGPNPLADGKVQEFFIEGAGLKIASLGFGDTALAGNPAVQQHLPEIVGKPYSRTAIDVFLAEQIKPIYLRQGFLQAKLGPPEVRLTGAPTEKLPEEIPVFVPVNAGAAYQLAGTSWTGNSVVSSFSLDSFFAMKSGAIADGMEVEAGFDRVREEYGRRGYLDASVQPEMSFDERLHTVSYKAVISEGGQYKMGGWVITGVSTNGEQRIRSTYPVASGDIFDKIKYEDFLVKLQTHSKDVWRDLPIHYESVGHWLRPDASKGTVDVLLDFK